MVGYDSAVIRERFAATARAVRELREVNMLLANGGQDWRPQGARGSELSDPTATTAIYNAEELAEKLEGLRNRRKVLTAYIAATSAMIDAVRIGLGGKYADVLTQRYIRCRKWSEIRRHGEPVPVSTGKMWVAVAFDWLASIGMTGLARYEYEL